MPRPSEPQPESHFDEVMRRAVTIKPEAKPKRKSGAKKKN